MRRHVNDGGPRVGKVTVDGADVTNRCFAFDTGLGVADCYVWHEGTTRVRIDPATREKVTEKLSGKVEAFDREGKKIA